MNNIRDYLAKIGRKGGKARLTKMTAEERRKIARKAIAARWEKFRTTLAETNAVLDKVEASQRSRPIRPKK